MVLSLTISILASSTLFVIFRLFEKFKISILNAIVVNYIVASSLSLSIAYSQAPVAKPDNWWPNALTLGLLFIALFNLMAWSSQKAGIASTGVANKMSFIGPVVFGLVTFTDVLNFFQGIGILLAVGAVFLSSAKDKSDNTKSNLKLPLILFLGGCILDIILGDSQKTIVPPIDTLYFTGSIFGFAGIFGIIYFVILGVRNGFKINSRDILWGVILGVPNFLSIYFFLKAIGEGDWTNSELFPIANMSIIFVNTILGLALFKEKLNTKNWIGILLSIAAILLITFG